VWDMGFMADPLLLLPGAAVDHVLTVLLRSTTPLTVGWVVLPVIGAVPPTWQSRLARHVLLLLLLLLLPVLPCGLGMVAAGIGS
jgi:hypothetical protein